MTLQFQKSIDSPKLSLAKGQTSDFIRTLAAGDWSSLNVSAYNGGPLMKVETDGGLTVVFEVFDTRPKKTLCFYDVCLAEYADRTIQRILKQKSEAKRPLPRSIAAFSKVVPDWALRSPNGLEELIRLEKASLLLTKEQDDVLRLKPPLTIQGRAGSGKTLLICYSLAQSIRNGSDARNRLAFLSYNSRLVEKARHDTGEIMQGLYDSTAGLEGVNFSSLRDFLLGYVKNRDRYAPESYITFSRFKALYANFSRGQPSLKMISAEKAWHGVRSILKGACLPPSSPPLSVREYDRLARRRRDFPLGEFDSIYKIGEWYQREVIKKGKFWDDQDLAWDALDSIIRDKAFSPSFRQYDQIFCDEAQDLTQLEFRALMELCKPPSGLTEGFQITMAGDPLQTINPTGFKWSVIRDEVYRVLQGSVVQFRELGENFRSDKRIVDFANRIQEIRGYYMDQAMAPQEGLVEDGETPQVIALESEDEVRLVRDKLGKLPPESAVIVWPEEKDQVSKLYEGEQALGKVDRQLDLYTVSEAKGLEFKLVVLYKLGSSSEANRLRGYLAPKQMSGRSRPTIKDEIELLYFLNRLYVAVTRAKLYLVVIDSQSGIKNFWSLWKDALEFVPRKDVHATVERSPVFQGKLSEADWRDWGETLLDHAEDTLDIRTFERARRAFERAGDDGKVRWVTARVEELSGNLAEAGRIYSENHDYLRSADCYEKLGLWSEAYAALELIPTTTEISRRMAICKFKRDLPSKRHEAAREFYAFFTHDKGLDRASLEQLGDILTEVDSTAAADVFEYVGRESSNKPLLARAAALRLALKDFPKAVELYELAGDKTSVGYNKSLAEKLNMNKDYAGAIETLQRTGDHARVVEVYESAIESKWSPGETRKVVADSYKAVGRTDEAFMILEGLSVDLTARHQWAKALECIRPDLFSYDAKIESCSRILSAAIEAKGTITDKDKEPLIIVARFVVADPYWDLRIKPESMGVIYEQCGTARERVDFYRRFLDQPWAPKPYLDALETLLKYHREHGDSARAVETETEITSFKADRGIQ